MKKIIITSFILAVCMLIIPFSVPKKEKKQEKSPVALKVNAQVSNEPAKEISPVSFRIKTQDKIITLSAQEYITGVVAAEMPVSYGQEALKAQSVAAYSFALYKKEHNKEADYDLTDSYKTDQSYLSEEAIKEKWGKEYAANIKKIKEAVLAVSGEYLSFNGSPALAMYHALSCGKTNACEDVFGSKVEYLACVNSKSDILSPNYKTEIKIDEEELNKKLSPVKKTKTKNAFSDIKTGKNAVVKTVKFAGKTLSGTALAGLLGLPSPNFSVKYSKGKYVFTCLGRGHGVGLSQYGAGQMALSGSSYREILAHYYPKTKLEKN